MTKSLYFIWDCDENCKIGLASNLDTRLRDLQTGNVRKLELLGFMPAAGPSYEKTVHRILTDWGAWVRGEWFDVGAAMLFARKVIPLLGWSFVPAIPSDFYLQDLEVWVTAEVEAAASATIASFTDSRNPARRAASATARRASPRGSQASRTARARPLRE